MKNKSIYTLAILMLWATISKADHDSPMGSVGLLLYEAQELQENVRYSTLSYNVKQTVNSFYNDVYRLAQCVKYGGRDGRDHLDDPGCSSACGMYLNQTRQSFTYVERYLYDTQYDYPNVYHSYLDTRRSLYAITVGGSVQPSMYKCTAVDNGWEEHWGGHAAYGRNLSLAQRSALVECQRHHGSCRIKTCEVVRR